MTPELELLVWSVGLTIVQVLVAVVGATLQVGTPALAGNRETLPPIEGWAGRAARAHFPYAEFPQAAPQRLPRHPAMSAWRPPLP